MKAKDLAEAGYYWCTHDLAMWIPHGEQYPKEWHVVQLGDSVVWHAGADVSTHVGDIPDYVDFYGPMLAPTNHWMPIDTAPKDGKPIDVWTADGRLADVRWMNPDRCLLSDPKQPPAWCVLEPHYDSSHWHQVEPSPTHWMPLPCPPE